MSNIHFKRQILADAFRSVQDYSGQHYGQDAVKPEHLKAITIEAFERLKQQDRSLKKFDGKCLNTCQRKQLIDIAKKIIVSPCTPLKPTFANQAKTAKIQNLFLKVLRGQNPSVEELLKDDALLKALVWKMNPEMLREGRELLQQLLEDLCAELDGKEVDSASPHKNDFHFEMIVGDLLCLYPFLRPENGEKMKVPVIVDGKWRRVEYVVQKITLTPEWMGSPMVAFGLASKQIPIAPPLLLFKGTTYPTDEGFWLSLLADLNPLDSVGALAYRYGKKNIESWLMQHADKKNKATLYGKSLGGALSWRTALHFHDQIGKVMAYGAPGFSSDEVRQLNRVMRQSALPEIHVFCQKGDHVPFFDKMPQKGVNYYLVLGEKKRAGFLAHVEIYSTHPHSAVIRLNVSKEAASFRRLSLSALRLALSLSLFPYMLLNYSFHLTIRKSVKLICRI